MVFAREPTVRLLDVFLGGAALDADGVMGAKTKAALIEFQKKTVAEAEADARDGGTPTLVGTVVATWMTGRFARMNAAAVFVSLLFWGWLWGGMGLLLAVPITAAEPGAVIASMA